MNIIKNINTKNIFLISFIILSIFLIIYGFYIKNNKEQNTDIKSYRIYSTLGDIQIFSRRGRPQRTKNGNIDELKIIGLQKNLSYETSFGLKKYIGIFYKTELNNSEIERFIKEQNLVKINDNIEYIFSNKIQKNKKELNILGMDTKLLDNIVTDKKNITIYSTEKTYKENQYTISLYYTKSWIMIDIYEKSLASKNGNEVIAETEIKTVGDKNYKKVTLVPFASATNGPDLACEYMKLIDETGLEISIPEEIRKYTICEDVQIVSPNYRFVLYNYIKPTDKESSFVVYDIEANKKYTIGTEFIGVDALQCKRSPDSKYIICSVIGQEGLAKLGNINKEDLPHISKFTIFELGSNGALINKKEIFQKNNETIQFTCGDNCSISDFTVGQDNIEYIGHEILTDSKGFNIKYK